MEYQLSWAVALTHQPGWPMQHREWPKTTLLISATILAGLIAFIWLGALGFAARNVAADREFISIVASFPREKAMWDALQRAHLFAGSWPREPNRCYTVWRRPTSFFDIISDYYYMATDRGSRRFIGAVFFDSRSLVPTDREMTSYTRVLTGNSVYKRN
jgi:hypothetical protein